jgi:predicted phage terminase large subunit-like protein
MTISVDHNSACRNLIQNPSYQQLFGSRFRLADDRNLAAQFANDRQGVMVATSPESRAMGRGGDVIILDDIITQEAALSDLNRKSVNDWLSQTMYQRLNDPETSAIILIMQRLHELDPTGYLLEREPGVWTHVKLPLLAEQDETWTLPISGRVVQRKQGECLLPKRFGKKAVERAQRDRFVFSGQYQQEPSPVEGNLIRRSDVRYYGGVDALTGARDEQLPERFDAKYLSADCAFKDLKSSDYVSILAVGTVGRKRYVLNVVNEHLDFSATEAEIRRQIEIHKPIAGVLIEDKANGSAVISRLKQNVSGVVEVQPQGGKVARMQASAPSWQAGDWYVSRTAGWADPFINQLLMFPAGRHDDMCDAMSQCAIYLQDQDVSRWWFVDGAHKHALGEDTAIVNPYFGPLGPARTRAEAEEQFETLAEAQKQGLTGEARAQFNARRNLDKVKAASLPVCLVCGKPASATREVKWCNSCGWREIVREPDSPQIQQRGW